MFTQGTDFQYKNKKILKERYPHNFSSMFHFYTPWKRQSTSGFLTFSGGIEMKHWVKWVKNKDTRPTLIDVALVALPLTSSSLI